MTRFSLLGYYIIKFHSERVSINQRPGWPSCFSDRPEKKPHKIGRGRWGLSSCQFRLAISEKKSKMRKLTTDGRTTDGRRATRDHNSALAPSAHVYY